MNKKLTITIALLTLLSLSVYVSAIQMGKDIPGYGTIEADFQQTSIAAMNGWNLIKGFPNPDWIFDGDVSPNQIMAIYALDPISKKYIRFYPKNEELSEVDISMDYLIGNTAFWVYIRGLENDGEMEYYTMEATPLNKHQLFSGWNFLSITSEMTEDFSGSCNVEKAYFWDMANKKWTKFPYSNPKQFTWDGDTIFGYGLAIKVSNDCTLGEKVEPITPIPTLPN